MSPLEKVVFLKNMCLADTSVRGKKWQMALFQVGSWIQIFEIEYNSLFLCLVPRLFYVVKERLLKFRK